MDTLGEILIQTGFGSNYLDHLSKIRLAAEDNDIPGFNTLVLNNTLFGSAGALWEIWIENKSKREEFHKQFNNFIDCLKKTGIEDGSINQVRSTRDF